MFIYSRFNQQEIREYSKEFENRLNWDPTGFSTEICLFTNRIGHNGNDKNWDVTNKKYVYRQQQSRYDIVRDDIVYKCVQPCTTYERNRNLLSNPRGMFCAKIEDTSHRSKGSEIHHRKACEIISTILSPAVVDNWHHFWGWPSDQHSTWHLVTKCDQQKSHSDHGRL